MEDETLFAEIARSFKGRQRWIVVWVWLWTLGFFGVSVWAAVRFFGAGSERDHILYATLFLWGLLVTGLLKSWYWGRLDRIAILRALNRRDR